MSYEVSGLEPLPLLCIYPSVPVTFRRMLGTVTSAKCVYEFAVTKNYTNTHWTCVDLRVFFKHQSPPDFQAQSQSETFVRKIDSRHKQTFLKKINQTYLALFSSPCGQFFHHLQTIEALKAFSDFEGMI